MLGIWLSIWGTLAGAMVTGGQTPTVTTDHFSYLPGEDIAATFKSGPGNRKDWLGIYPRDVEPGGPSTAWNYVDSTQTGNTALMEGTVVFPGGLNEAGDWTMHLCVNDGYDSVARSNFRVIDPVMPFIRPENRVYVTGTAITVNFTNGPANPADWIGIYQAGEVPDGDPVSILWNYVGGTQSSGEGKSSGSVSFPTGLATPGEYEVFFLENDGYTVLASEPFTVVAPSGLKARVSQVNPAPDAVDIPPQVELSAVITNETTSVVISSIKLSVDGAVVTPTVSAITGGAQVTYTNTVLFASESTHAYELVFADNGIPSATITNRIAFTVAKYQNVVLPAPLYFENFDSTPEGQLPAGWTHKSFTEIQNFEFDLSNLDSASYATWVVVAADRFKGSFITYSNPDNPDDLEADYHRVLSVNPLNVVNGQVYKEPLASGNFVFGNSGYRNGACQVVYLFTPDYDLTGKNNIYVSFHSLWEQNQDSIAAVEYSIDQGQTWLPIVYMIDTTDIVRDAQTNIDAVATLTAEHDDVALYIDPETGADVGRTYGAFIGAPISAALAPFISARINDDTSGSKRVEYFRLLQADGQAKVRFRFAHAGTDSWYFGVDDFGLYSVSAEPLQIQGMKIKDGKFSFSWTGGQGPFQVYKSASLAPGSWSPAGAATEERSFTETAGNGSAFYYVKGQ
jgi:hypothetical protein